MVVSDADRLRLHERMRTAVGDEAAGTLMDMLVPAGEVPATRADVERSEAALRSEMQAMEGRLRGEMKVMAAELRGEMQAMEGRLRGEIGVLAAEVHALRDVTATKAFVLGTILSTVLPLYAGMAGLYFLIARG